MALLSGALSSWRQCAGGGLLLGALASGACTRAPAPGEATGPAGAALPGVAAGLASAAGLTSAAAAGSGPAGGEGGAGQGGGAGGSGQAGEATAEAWGPGLIDSGPCAPHRETQAATTLREAGGAKKLYSVDGYTAWTLRLERVIEGKTRTHCVTVAFPPGDRSSDGRPVAVAGRIDEAWLRLIENTLARLPWRHLQSMRRAVIDERPKEHGIASFDRRKADDGRDGHTIWLHTRLFTEPNHWAHGNHGRYWSYHLDVDDESIDNQRPDHARFSPVLLHEIGHLVAYNVVNGNPANEAVPACARICGDRPGGCRGMLAAVREEGCVSAYCMPFQFETGTENWAEIYRFYFQSKAARDRLSAAAPACLRTLAALDEGRGAPWAAGLPDIADYRPTLWSSCAERPCKAW